MDNISLRDAVVNNGSCHIRNERRGENEHRLSRLEHRMYVVSEEASGLECHGAYYV